MQLVALNRGRSLDHRDVRGRAVRRRVQRQRDRALPRRRAHVDAVPLRGAAVGDPERADRLRHVPRRLQHLRDDARGKGEADPLAQPSRGRRRLALRQGPLRVLAPLRDRPHHRAAARARRSAGARAGAVGRGARRGRTAAALRPARTSSPRSPAPRPWSRRTRSRSCCAAGSARTPRSCPEVENARALDGFRRPLSSIRDADVIVGPRRRAARGARADRRSLGARGADATGAEILYELDEEKVRGAERAILIWSGPEPASATLAAARRAPRRMGRVLRPARRRTRAASARRGPRRPTRRSAEDPDPIAPARHLRATRRSRIPTCARSRSRPSTSSSSRCSTGPARAARRPASCPGTSYLEREGTYVNLEGRLQRLRRAVVPPAPDELAWISKLARALRRRPLAVRRRSYSTSCRAHLRRAPLLGEIGEQRAAPVARRPERRAAVAQPQPRRPPRARRGLRLVTYRPLFSGPAVERVPELQFQRAAARARDRRRRRTRARDPSPATRSRCARTGRRRACARASRGTLAAGTVRAAEEHVRGLAPRRRG